jgi:hypothetical protein
MKLYSWLIFWVFSASAWKLNLFLDREGKILTLPPFPSPSPSLSPSHQFHYVAQTDLELKILLPQSPEYKWRRFINKSLKMNLGLMSLEIFHIIICMTIESLRITEQRKCLNLSPEGKSVLTFNDVSTWNNEWLHSAKKVNGLFQFLL